MTSVCTEHMNDVGMVMVAVGVGLVAYVWTKKQRDDAILAGARVHMKSQARPTDTSRVVHQPRQAPEDFHVEPPANEMDTDDDDDDDE